MKKFTIILALGESSYNYHIEAADHYQAFKAAAMDNHMCAGFDEADFELALDDYKCIAIFEGFQENLYCSQW